MQVFFLAALRSLFLLFVFTFAFAAGCYSGVYDPEVCSSPEPGADPVCETVNCSQWAGNEFTDPWKDSDQDGIGACAEAVAYGCGYALGCDCNDLDANVSPGLPLDGCNGQDSDCDGIVDEDGSEGTHICETDEW